MFEVNAEIKKQVDEINNENLEKLRKLVRNKITYIAEKQNQVQKLLAEIQQLKADMKELKYEEITADTFQ